jgi:hypothetical protein
VFTLSNILLFLKMEYRPGPSVDRSNKGKRLFTDEEVRDFVYDDDSDRDFMLSNADSDKSYVPSGSSDESDIDAIENEEADTPPTKKPCKKAKPTVLLPRAVQNIAENNIDNNWHTADIGSKTKQL